MSHATGQVKFNDGIILWFEYNGTSDICKPKLFESQRELNVNWRKEQKNTTCSCERAEDVEIFSSYGDGSSWEGKACRYCMCIIRPLIPKFEDVIDGIPDWIEK